MPNWCKVMQLQREDRGHIENRGGRWCGGIINAIASIGAWSSAALLEPGEIQLVHKDLHEYFQRKLPILLGCVEKRCIDQNQETSVYM
jgi:hypothetical protein